MREGIPESKNCLRCHAVKPLTEFYNDKKGKFGKDSHCKECADSEIKAYRQTHPEVGKKTAKAWKDRNPEKVRAHHRNRYKRLWNAVLGHYGRKCACCGETEELFLSVDHVKNDGHLDQRNGNDLWAYIVKNNFPPDFQILCSNCNVGKYRNGGVCPHKTREAQIAAD